MVAITNGIPGRLAEAIKQLEKAGMNQATKAQAGPAPTASGHGHQAGGGSAPERERQQLETLRIARAGSGEPYSADEYISALIRRDWERWLEQEAELKQQICQNCDCALPEGCGGTFKGEIACWQTWKVIKTLAL